MLRFCVGRAWVLAAFLCLLAACGSKGRLTVVDSKKVSIPAGTVVALDIKTIHNLRDKPYVAASALIRKHLTRQLVSERIFRSVTDTSNVADYSINVLITKADLVHGAERAARRGRSRRSSVEVMVKVRNTASQEMITSFKAAGYGARMFLSPKAYGLDDPAQEVVQGIVKALR